MNLINNPANVGGVRVASGNYTSNAHAGAHDVDNVSQAGSAYVGKSRL